MTHARRDYVLRGQVNEPYTATQHSGQSSTMLRFLYPSSPKLWAVVA